MDNPETHKEDGKDATVTDSAFYTDAADYWASVPATVDGMLGGLSSISDIDLKGSQRFLNSIYQVCFQLIQALTSSFLGTIDPCYDLSNRYNFQRFLIYLSNTFVEFIIWIRNWFKF